MKLNKEEMKNVFGGMDREVTCTFYYVSGPASQSSCKNSPDDCQWGADFICENNDNCVDVDCR
jgi:hypothetical protein